MISQEIIQWGSKYLSSHSYQLKNNLPEKVKDTPWSYVARFITTDGYIYLKHTPDLLALEPIITQILHDQFNASVPKIIANNSALNCFLMKDSGNPLREILKKQFDVNLSCKAIDQFTSLQLAVASHINIFLDLGIPDWRLDKLPALFRQLLLQKDILIDDGLSESDIAKLEILLPKISDLCKKLSNAPIKQTIVQCDFHDNNNILIDDISQIITFIDLGEIVISHPFFSLIGFLHQMKKHHGLTNKDDTYLQLMDACFKNYLPFESKTNLIEFFTTAQILWFVYEILAQYRLMLACGKDKLMSFQHGKLSNSLREFIILCDG